MVHYNMAVFFKNDCKFSGCGKKFQTLSSLIEHVENAHLDFSPEVTEEFENQRPCEIPLSYVLKYSNNLQKKTKSSARPHDLFKTFGKLLENKGNYINDDEIFTESESSNDSWTPNKKISHKRKSNLPGLTYKIRPFACSMPGCTKSYKNVNGIKYHYKNGHKTLNKPKNVKQMSMAKKDKNKINVLKKKITPEISYSSLPPTPISKKISKLKRINQLYYNETIGAPSFSKAKHFKSSIANVTDNSKQFCCNSSLPNDYNRWSFNYNTPYNDLFFQNISNFENVC